MSLRRIHVVSLCIVLLGPLALTACKNLDTGRIDVQERRATYIKGASGSRSVSMPRNAAIRRLGQGKATTRDASSPSSSPFHSELHWSSLAFPTGDERTSAILLSKGVPTEVQLNKPFEYQLEVTNLTDQSILGVVVTERLPANFSFKSSMPVVRSKDKGLVQWAFRKLGPREGRIIRIRGTATGLGNLDGRATVTYDSSISTSIAVVKPEIKLKRIAPAEILLCEDIRIRYVVSNTGTGTAWNIEITEKLSDNLTTVNKGPVSFHVVSLEPGKSHKFHVDLRAAKTGTYSGVAVAKAEGDFGAKSESTTTIVREPVLKLQITGPKQGVIGDEVTYDITVFNVGDGVARSATVEEHIPQDAQFVRASLGGRVLGGKVVWMLGDISPKSNRKMSVTLLVKAASRMKSDAVAKAKCATLAQAHVETKVIGIPAILLEVGDVNDPIAVGGTVAYEICVTNQGTAPGTGIRVECVLEDTMEFVSAGGATTGTLQGNKVIFQPLFRLLPKGKASWRVVVKAKKQSDARFKVKMTSDQLKRPVEETEASNFYK